MARARSGVAGGPLLFDLGPQSSVAASVASGAGYARVALNKPLEREFSYSVPPELAEHVAVGMRVAVPFGPKRELGVVVALERECEHEPARIKPIHKLLDERPLVDAQLLGLTRWVAQRYACSWGEALHALLPAALKHEKGVAKVLYVRASEGVGDEQLAELEATQPKQHRLLRTLIELGGRIELRELCQQLNLSDSAARSLHKRGWVSIEKLAAARDEFETAAASRPRPAALHPQQSAALARLVAALERDSGSAFLLQGVTGSGKTEVYLALIERALALGRGAIVLVPEIALTPQTVGWFRARFDAVAVLHSKMSDAQRLGAWRRVASGEARVVVGARSAVFAPMERLGVIVVDEEHEPSFKQGSTPRYHARDVAIERALRAKAVCVLGSATPSLESWQAAREGRLERLELSVRISDHGAPPIEVIDMRSEPIGPTGHKLFSRRLMTLLGETLARGEQAILFQNRRGFAPVLWCSGCKQTVCCAHCDVALAWHQRIARLVCHSCCEETRQPKNCPTCTKPGLHYVGAGAERIEHEIARAAPNARVRRMDSDTMKRREDYESTLAAFGAGEIDVLVGTQMIAKGLDFPRVTLVGIVSADSALHLPDFRAAERTFQLISQVSGRAGRGDLAGRIVVQTLAPTHPAITLAAAHDFEGFARVESEQRAELNYPPHGALVRLVFEDASEKAVIDGAREFADLVRSQLEALEAHEVSVLGPAPAPISMARGRHRHHLLIKAPRAGLDAALGAIRAARTALRSLAPTIDVDPASML